METRVALALIAEHTVTSPGTLIDSRAVRNSTATTSPSVTAFTLIDCYTAAVT